MIPFCTAFQGRLVGPLKYSCLRLQAKLVALIAQYGESDSQLAVGAPVKNLLFWSGSGTGAAGAAPDMSVHSLELSDCLQGVGLLCESV